MLGSDDDFHRVLDLLKIDQYYLKKDRPSAQLSVGHKKYLILLANKNKLPPGDLLFLLKNILKFLKIPEESCFFLWPDQQASADFNQEIGEVFLKIQAEFIFNFGLNLNINFRLPVTMQTLDLSSVLLDPKLKRQVFDDVSRLLLSPTGA